MMLGGGLLNTDIEERVVNAGNYIVENRATVRAAAKVFGVSKSTIHKDITERLKKINPALARKAKKILDENKAERHIRGGIATKNKYNSKKVCWCRPFLMAKSYKLLNFCDLSGIIKDNYFLSEFTIWKGGDFRNEKM